MPASLVWMCHVTACFRGLDPILVHFLTELVSSGEGSVSGNWVLNDSIVCCKVTIISIWCNTKASSLLILDSNLILHLDLDDQVEAKIEVAGELFAFENNVSTLFCRVCTVRSRSGS